MGNDIGTGRTEGIEPVKRTLTYLLFSVIRFLYYNKMVQNWRFIYIKKKSNKNSRS